MNTNRARAQLGAVQYNVVSERAHRTRITLQLIHVLIVRRGERMVRRIPPALGLVPLEHGKIGDPEKSVICGCTLSLEKLVTACEFLCQRQPYLPGTFEDLPFAHGKPESSASDITRSTAASARRSLNPTASRRHLPLD